MGERLYRGVYGAYDGSLDFNYRIYVVVASSREEAIGMGYTQCLKTYPQSLGYMAHAVDALEITPELYDAAYSGYFGDK